MQQCVFCYQRSDILPVSANQVQILNKVNNINLTGPAPNSPYRRAFVGVRSIFNKNSRGEFQSPDSPSGGAADSFTCAIAHNDNNTAVLDCLVEIKAPFNPDSATIDLAATLKSYGLNKTTADHYAAQWLVAALALHGITLTHSEPKADEHFRSTSYKISRRFERSRNLGQRRLLSFAYWHAADAEESTFL